MLRAGTAPALPVAEAGTSNPRKAGKTATDITAMAPGYRNPWKEREKAFSPTTLKNFLACPMRFWVREALHLNEDEFQPDKEDMAANELGTMLHDVLEQFCRLHPSLEDGMTTASLQREIGEILDETFTRQYGQPPAHAPASAEALHGTAAERVRGTAFGGPPERMDMHRL